MVERVLTGKVRSLFAIYPTKIPLPLLLSILLLLPLILSRVFKIAIFWTSAKFPTRAGGDRGCALLKRPSVRCGAHQVIVLVCSLCCSLCCSLWRSLASGFSSRRAPTPKSHPEPCAHQPTSVLLPSPCHLVSWWIMKSFKVTLMLDWHGQRLQSFLRMWKKNSVDSNSTLKWWQCSISPPQVTAIRVIGLICMICPWKSLEASGTSWWLRRGRLLLRMTHRIL